MFDMLNLTVGNNTCQMSLAAHYTNDWDANTNTQKYR